MEVFITLRMISIIGFCGVTLSDEEEPSNYNEAISHPTAGAEWAKACESEWQSWRDIDCNEVLSVEELEQLGTSSSHSSC